MNRELGLHSEPWTIRPHFRHNSERDGLPSTMTTGPVAFPTLLIEVPTIPPVVKDARRPSPSAFDQVRAAALRNGAKRRRRRLRREVRLAGLAMLTVITIMSAAMALRSGQDRWSGAAGSSRRPTVSLSLDPTALGQPEAPVSLPGYLLPDDGAEEPNHVGG